MAKLHTTPEERERKDISPNRTVGVYETKGKGRSKTMMIIAIIALIILAIFLISQLT